MIQISPTRKLVKEMKALRVKNNQLMLGLFFLVALIGLFSLVTTKESEVIDFTINWDSVPTTPASAASSQVSSFGSCVCDLTVNQCDPNCCCDPDCASDLMTKSFSKCALPLSKKDFNYKCVEKNLVTFSNVNSNIKVNEAVQSAGTPLFCVYFDATSVDGIYYAAVDDLDASGVEKVVNIIDATSDYVRSTSLGKIHDLQDNITTSSNKKWAYYIYGDRIPVLINTSTTSTYLKLTRGKNSDLCQKFNYPQFMENMEESSCYWVPSASDTLMSRCASDFNLDYMASMFVGKVGLPSNTQQFISVNIAEIIKVDALGIETEVDFSTTSTSYVTASSTCRNAITSIHYYFTYSNIGTVTSVNLAIKIMDLVNPSSVKLTNLVQYINGYLSNWESGISKVKSGNPGYIRQKPVLAGTLQTNNGKSAIYQSAFGIQVPSGYGCSQQNTIQFDVDTVYGCSLAMNISALKDVCNGNSISEITSSITHVGRYGNADYTNVNDWVKIYETSKPSSTWDDLTQTCNNIAGGVEYQIVIAKSGSINNEQWKIQGIRKVYYSLTWTFPSSASTSNFWVETRVRFVRVSGQETVQKNYPAPNLLPFLPEDVFYPFSLILTGSANTLSYSLSLVTVLLYSFLM